MKNFPLIMVREHMPPATIWNANLSKLFFAKSVSCLKVAPLLTVTWKFKSKSHSSWDRSCCSPAPLESVNMCISTELGLFSMACCRDVIVCCHCVHGWLILPPCWHSVLSVFHNLFGSEKSRKVTIYIKNIPSVKSPPKVLTATWRYP